MTTTQEGQRDDVELQFLTFDELEAWDRNPKDHDVGLLITSLRTYGLIRPPAINTTTGKLLYGHGLSKALKTMHESGEDPPRRVRADNGTWTIPTHVVDLEEPLHEPYLVIDNRSTELGGWDRGLLPDVLSDIAERGYLEATGFDGDDLDVMLTNNPAYSEPEDGEVPRLDERSPVICPICGHEFTP